MPRGGHNKKSNKILHLEGSPRAMSQDPSPKPVPIFPTKPPRGLPKYARQFWKDYAPKLEDMGVLTEVDVPGFHVLAMTYQTIRQAEKEIEERGLLLPGARGGDLVKNPAVSILNAARQQFRLMCQEFGLYPHSRNRLNVTAETGEPDAMELLLSK